MIIGDRVRLRGVERTDLPHFVCWMNDPEVIEGLVIYLPLSLADEERWFEGALGRPPELKPLAVEVRDGEDWRLAGSCGFHGIEAHNRSAEIGLVLGDKSTWGRGYGRELVGLMLRHGFATLNLNRVWLRVHETNERAIHVYEQCGFLHEGRQRQAVYRNGAYQDLLFMGILRSEWDSLDK